MFKSWPVTLSGRILMIRALPLWFGIVSALAFTVLIYSIYVWHSEMLLLKDFHKKEGLALMRFYPLLAWQPASLLQRERLSSDTQILNIAFPLPHGGWYRYFTRNKSSLGKGLCWLY